MGVNHSLLMCIFHPIYWEWKALQSLEVDEGLMLRGIFIQARVTPPAVQLDAGGPAYKKGTQKMLRKTLQSVGSLYQIPGASTPNSISWVATNKRNLFSHGSLQTRSLKSKCHKGHAPSEGSSVESSLASVAYSGGQQPMMVRGQEKAFSFLSRCPSFLVGHQSYQIQEPL